MITVEEIAKRAPAAMARKPAAHCSPQYTFIPTMDAIDALRKEGFIPVDARQSNCKNDRWGASKHMRHMIVMRMRGTETWDKNAMMGGLVPEIRLYNSSDASSPFDLIQGIFRKVCSNGLIVMTVNERVHHVHKYVTAEDVIEHARQLSQNSKPLFDKIQKWTKIRLNDTAQKRYAAQALQIRLGGDAERAKRYEAASVVAIRRPEDEAPTLWNLFNRAQENGMRGAVAAVEGAGTGVGLRMLTNINNEQRFNAELWKMTEKWAAIV